MPLLAATCCRHTPFRHSSIAFDAIFHAALSVIDAGSSVCRRYMPALFDFADMKRFQLLRPLAMPPLFRYFR